MNILIPNDAVRCVVRGRHSHSVQEGSNETRTLTAEGVKLCGDVKADYCELLDELAARFGVPRFACSEFPRSMLTCFLVTGASQITRDSHLNLEASVKKSPAPTGSPHADLYTHWKAEGLGIPEMLQRLAADPSLFGDQPVAKALENAADFVKHAFPEACLVVAFDHEPAISLYAAQCNAPTSYLGLEECQAFVFFLDAHGDVISVQKFTPVATLADQA